MPQTLRPGTKLTAWLAPDLEAHASLIAGRGLFAGRWIEAGEVVAVWGGTLFSEAEVQAGQADPETIAILDEGLYLAEPVGAAAVEEYPLNHACDSNLWMHDAITLAARRRIAPGEELTADYALWLYNVPWTLEVCRCGSPLCRGRITDGDWRLPEVQARYAGHFTPFLNLKIAQLRGTPAAMGE